MLSAQPGLQAGLGEMLWLGCKCGHTERTTAEWKQTVAESSQADTHCLLMPITAMSRWAFLCENRQIAREKPCEGAMRARWAVLTCDCGIKARVSPRDDFTRAGFGCSHYCIDFLFLSYFENHFFEAKAKPDTLCTQTLASAKWEATAEFAAKCFNLDPQTSR